MGEKGSGRRGGGSEEMRGVDRGKKMWSESREWNEEEKEGVEGESNEEEKEGVGGEWSGEETEGVKWSE